MKQLRGNWGREKISHTWGKALRVWMVQGLGGRARWPTLETAWGWVAQSLECPTNNLAPPKPVSSYSWGEEEMNIYLCHLINACLSQHSVSPVGVERGAVP